MISEDYFKPSPFMEKTDPFVAIIEKKKNSFKFKIYAVDCWVGGVPLCSNPKDPEGDKVITKLAKPLAIGYMDSKMKLKLKIETYSTPEYFKDLISIVDKSINDANAYCDRLFWAKRNLVRRADGDLVEIGYTATCVRCNTQVEAESTYRGSFKALKIPERYDFKPLCCDCYQILKLLNEATQHD